MVRRYWLLIVTMFLAIWLSMVVPAWAVTNYSFILRENWIPPRNTAVELGSLIIDIDPITEGEHRALFALPDGFAIDPPGDISSNQDPLVIIKTSLISQHEFLGVINAPGGFDKYTFIVPIRSTIPSGVRGDFKITITPLTGQFTGGTVVAGSGLPGELTIATSGVGVIKDERSLVQIILSENMAGLLSKYSKIKLTLPEGFAWDGAKGELVEGEGLEARPVVDGRVLEVHTSRESTTRSVFRVEAGVRLVNEAKAGDGEVRAVVEGLRSKSGQTVLVAHYQAPEQPDPVVPEKFRAAFTVGSTVYKYGTDIGEMDIAPYVQDGRMYLPLRYVAVSLDVHSIAWDGRVATLTKDGRTLQVSPGVRTMLVNGVALEMDAAPELVPPGRLMLPYRFVAGAFGAVVDWDGDGKTVNLTIN